MTFDMLPLRDYVEIYGGVPDEDDLNQLTQDFISIYHKEDVDPFELISGFGIDWLELLLEHNEELEEYELCAIFRDLINDFRNEI